MPRKLYRATEVCQIAELQPFVLRAWEKDFPGIGVKSGTDGTRLYRQVDIDQVRRIKELVFDEGLTVSGARRRLEDSGVESVVSDEEAAEVFDALWADARAHIAKVREGLRGLMQMLTVAPGAAGQVDELRLKAALSGVRAPAEGGRQKSSAKAGQQGSSRSTLRNAAKAKGGSKSKASKRKRARA